MDNNNGHDRLIREAFQDSRNRAILRCAEIMIESKRKDIAREIFKTTRIDRSRLMELKDQLTRKKT